MRKEQLVCDLEVHSKYARAVSSKMDVLEMARWAVLKGVDVIGTGDMTHPLWLENLRNYLEEDGSGLLKLKKEYKINERPPARRAFGRFMLTGEVATIFSQGGRARRVHVIVVAPGFTFVQKLNQRLSVYGRLASDGRPMLGLSCQQLLEYVLEVNQELGLTDDCTSSSYKNNPGGFIIPAHVWTPWFGLYGSKSGFNSLAECFGSLSSHVRAIETGLSSDIPMNWRLSAHDRLALVSFSDAHSAPNLMREATVVYVPERSYAALAQALQNPYVTGDNIIAKTLEFFPQEGKYHYDGIADKGLSLHPTQTKKLWQTDPALAKKVTVGVLSRVNELADRSAEYKPKNRPSFISVIPLQEILADLAGVRKQSKRVLRRYEELVAAAAEFQYLVSMSEEQLRSVVDESLANAIMAVRRGEVAVQPGYDGIYGTIKIQKKNVI